MRRLVLGCLLLAAWPAAAQVITSADLQISGASFKIVNSTVTAQQGTPAIVQTSIGDLQNDQAPVFNDGTFATGELIGPGIVTPVPFITAPGHAFTISGLSQEGTYYLQNVRMMKGDALLQMATPSLAILQVTNALNATVTVKQLSADDLRKRGISLNPANYDVYQYTFSFLVNGQTVEIPYPVIINRLTHEVTPLPQESPYNLPTDTTKAPPRWNPPATIPVEFPVPVDFSSPKQTEDNPDAAPPPRPSIHAAIVIPNSLAVLHEFFGVALVVTNGAPAGSEVTLDSITATIDASSQLRLAKVDPPVTFGRPVSITGPGGVVVLAAQMQGKAEWTYEGLKAGTYTIDLDVKATFHSKGQPDLPLEATPRAAVVVHDARFNITFSHPDTVRKGLQYSTHTYITNVSEAAQDIALSDGNLPICSSGNTHSFVCRVDTSPSSYALHLEPGETKSIEYKLQSSLTGSVFATAVSIDGANSAINSAAFTLDMGVSPTGVPLSPVTLVLPHYASTPYLSQPFLDDQLGFLGIAYSLATAPMNKVTAKFPRLIKSDVFTRAVDIARAGERIFIGDDRRDSLANLALDLLGNDLPLAEWDQFRRQEIVDPGGDSARAAMKALATELAGAYGADGTFNGMADRFAAATSTRAPYLFALAHGPKNGAAPAFTVRVAAGTQILDSAVRDIPYGELQALDAASESGTMAMIGSAPGAVDITVTANVSGASTLDLIIPAADGKSLIRVAAPFMATAGQAVHIRVAGGVATSSDLTLSPAGVAVAPLRIVAARQDLFLDGDGHVVSVLFNQKLPATAADLSADFDTDVTLDSAKYGVAFSGKRAVAGAALQTDGRIVRLNYDNALSNDAQYTIHHTAGSVVPKIEDRSSALILGSVLKGDNTPVAGAELFLSTATGQQHQIADASGQFLFEYVPRDPDNGITGGYTLQARAPGQVADITGAVRLLHAIHRVNVVFLGRGSAKGVVRYEDGTPVPNATVVIGSTMFSQFRSGGANAAGAYSITDLPVGPLTFSAQDAAGNVAYAANELHAAGELVIQDITIVRKAFPGTGTVRGRILRSDTSAPAANTHVGVYSQGYGLQDGFTDASGQYAFTKVPAGFVTVLAENYTIAPKSIAVDFDLKADEVHVVPDLELAVPATTRLVAITGTVTIEDPYVAGHFTPVPSAQVQIDGMPVTTAGADGTYRYDAVPSTFAGARVRGFDPKSGRLGTASLPGDLTQQDSYPVPIAITNVSGSGTGTVRVHLIDARGQAVSGYHVFEPGFPRLESAEIGEGVYEFKDLRVGSSMIVVAAPSGTRDQKYGYQWAQGGAAVSFPGQIVALTLRLPGQSDVHAVIMQATDAAPVRVKGQLHLTHRAWSDAEQQAVSLTRLASTDGTQDAIFDQVPAGESLFLETFESDGYASDRFTIGFDGQPVTRTLTLTTLSVVRGRVFMPDGYTPAAGALVNLTDSSQDLGWTAAALDGSFEFRDVAPHSGFTLRADFTQNGIYRSGYVTGNTPDSGGTVDGMSIILLEQGAVEGTVVDAGNHPIPFAKIWLRELSFLDRKFGTQQDPQLTDANGHFRFNNIFAVPFRINAEDPTNPDLKGSFNGVIGDEGVVVEATINVGGAGTGTVQITVKDPNNGFQPVANAEVSLFRGSLYDFATTDINGSVVFQQVPVGISYTASAYSKALGKLGATDTAFSVTKDNTTAIAINLAVSGEVSGTLDDLQNSAAPVPGANVTLNGTGYQTRATTSTTGAFDFLGVREGTVSLVAQDPSSIRQAKGSATVSTANRSVLVPLHLESTSTLTVKAFLPNDAGASSGVLVPGVIIDVSQSAPGGIYHRTSQINGDAFPGLVRNVGFALTVQEIGGLNRIVRVNDSFNTTTAAREIDVVLAATGSVVVHVQQGSPAADAPNVQVTASSGGVSTSAFTDATGRVTLSRLPLGTVSIQAKTAGSQPLTGAASVALTSQTQAASATILLGSYGGVTGKVITEGGGASAGTRVFAAFSGVQLETRTDPAGGYTFQGIATPLSGTTVNLTYLGPDDNTIGAAQSVVLRNGDGILQVPDVTLDSTPPRLVAIFPADGSTKVAPDTTLRFTFSRAVRDDQLNSGFFKLYDVGAAQQLTLTYATKDILADKSEIITFNLPPTPQGQRFPLKSNTLYRSEVSPDLQDLAGHKLAASVGASFTTSDYSNPQITKVEPKSPLPKNNFRIAVTFSKPIAGGTIQLTPISAIGGSVIGSPLAGQSQLDPATGATLYFAPDVFIAESSFYRLSVSGVTDLDGHTLIDAAGNPLPVFTQDFFSFDTTAPGITIANPTVNGTAIGNSDPLYPSTLYRFPVTLTNAADLDRVDFFSLDAAGVETKLNRSTATSTDLSLLPTLTTFTLEAVAYDLSGNHSSATRTWTVSQQTPLAVVSAAVTPATIYANNKLTDTVAISGGGLDATVKVTAKLGATVLTSAQTTITRVTFDAAWPSAALQISVPSTVAGGSHLTLVEDISDVRGGAATHSTDVTIATDTVAPLMQPLTLEPANTSFSNGNTFRVHAFARDGETGVQKVVFTVDGVPFTVTSGTLRNTGYTEYVSPSFTVKARNNDVAMPVTAVATDYAPLSTTATTAVTYLGQHDPNAPTVAWIAPLHDAAWPANTAFHAKLRVYAKSSLPLTGTFDVPLIGTGLAGTVNGSEIDLDVTFAQTPAANTPFQIVAHVSDGDGGHVIDLPIDIDLVDVGLTIHSGETVPVDAQHPLSADSVLVDAGGRLVPHVGVTLKNLIVVNGGLVDTVPSTTTLDQKLDLTVSGHVYVDDASSINVSSRGYLGGLQANFDSTGSNGDARGMTLGRNVGTGASNGASASYAGIGGADIGATNPTYGSITAPFDLGSGGAAKGTTRGGQGGGAASVAGAAKIVIAGVVTADGEGARFLGGAGSGGSIHLAGARIVVGAYATVSAIGGDDDASTNSGGAGGGRISLEATDLLEIDANNGTRVFAYGGRNLTGENAGVVDGGAGTIFLRSPQSANGDLTVSDYDPRNPTTIHEALSTVLDGNALSFDHVTVGPRALARADAALTINGAVDDRTKASIDPAGVLLLAGDLPTISTSTAPDKGSSVIAGTNINLTYTAGSLAGVASVTSTLAPAIGPSVDTYTFPTSVTKSPAKVLSIPNSAAAGTATLSVHVVDRAGRSADATPSTFTVIANTPPSLTAFDATAPSPLYIRGTINATVSATDDVGVSSMAVTAQFGAQTPVTQTFNPPANTTSASHTFAVTVPNDVTLDGATVTLTANVQDAAGAPGVSSAPRTFTIAHDGAAPSITITSPTVNQGFDEASGQTIPVVATVIDAESGVNTVTASVEGGAQNVTMTRTANANEYSASLQVPSVPGITDVSRIVTVAAADFQSNSASQTRSVTIHPFQDGAAPILTWNCNSDGAAYPVGRVVTLTVTAVPAAGGGAVDSVFFTDDKGSPNITTSKNGNVYTATYTMPAAAGTVLITAHATAGSHEQTLESKVTVVVVEKTIANGTIVNASDTTYDGKEVLIDGGTVTLIGHHQFKHLMVLNGATVQQKAADGAGAYGIDFKADGIFLACGTVIEVSGQGYGQNITYPNVTLNAGGGSHIGVGFNLSGTAGQPAYGSVYHPSEAGAGANDSFARGGGIVRLDATNVVVDGAIHANGNWGNNNRGAGGSVWITATKITGGGSIAADSFLGGQFGSGGGGGAIAIEYTDVGSVVPAMTARGGFSNQGFFGGGGSMYVKGAKSVYGDLTINNAGNNGIANDLPSMGGGTAQPGSGGTLLVTSSNIPLYFGAHWVEIKTAAGVVKNTWRVQSIDPADPRRVTLQPNAGETVDVQAGDTWQGTYRFDNIYGLATGSLSTNDLVKLGDGNPATTATINGPTNGQSFELKNALTLTQPLSVTGLIGAPGVAATSLRVPSGATLFGGSASLPMTITATTSVTVDAGGAIDVGGRGFGQNITYGGGTVAVVGGGSHIGYGYRDSGGGPAGVVYGSIYRPQEPGGGANNVDAKGGAALRINASTLTVNGAIRANGNWGGSERGAGGSVWITVSKISGTGSIAADSFLGNSFGPGGGGGAIAIEYTDATSTLPPMTARGGFSNQNQVGGAGSIYVKGPSSTYGDLTVDNGTRSDGQATELPSLGYGWAQSGSTGTLLTTERDIAAYFAGNYVEVKTTAGTRIGRVSIDPANPRRLTLQPDAGQTIDVHPGDAWRGVYRFDHFTASRSIVNSADRIDLLNPPAQLLNGATIVGNNQGLPVVDASKISIGNQSFGPVLVGSANAITDNDTPLTAFALNQTANTTLSTTVAANGSFQIPLRGSAGDSIAVYAKDGNAFPMQTQPLFVGTLPQANIQTSSTPITSSMTTDANFRARRLAVDGNVLVAQNYPSSTDTNKLLAFDLSTGVPVWTQTATLASNTRDVVVRNGVAYVAAAGSALYAVDLTVTPATVKSASPGCSDAQSVAVDGTFVYLGFAGNCTDGRLQVFDVSDPKTPVAYGGQQAMLSGVSSAPFTQLIPYGNYLIGVTTQGTHDVVAIDRRNPGALSKVWDTDIAGFTAFRASLQGSTLYVVSQQGSVAVVDLSTLPATNAGVVKSVTSLGTTGHGIQALNNFVAAAEDTAGLVTLDATSPTAPQPSGGILTSPQAAWDVVLRGQLGIIAAEDRLLTFTAPVAPQINASKISMSFDGHNVALTGAATAVAGAAPLTVQARDAATNAVSASVNVAADGSFAASLAANAGDAISVTATDRNALATTAAVGNVPFGASATFVPITAAMANNDASFRARLLAIDGTTLVTASTPSVTDSNKIIVFSIAGGTLTRTQTIVAPTFVRGMALRNNILYVAATGSAMYVYDLSVNPAVVKTFSPGCTDGSSVAVSGNYLYLGLAASCGDGRMVIYDISDPANPLQQVPASGSAQISTLPGLSGTWYSQLVPYGESYLIGVSNQGTHDVVVLDRRDRNTFVVVSNIDIPNFTGFKGAVLGNMLYIAGSGKMAAVDLTNPASPTYAVISVGAANGVAVAGNRVAIGDGPVGVSFADVTTPSAPRLVATQSVGGSSWDVVFYGGRLYAAAEEGIAIINNVVAPPVVDPNRVAVTRSATAAAAVAGSANAVSGAAPLTLVVRDDTASTHVTGVAVNADGSFSASIAATPGDAVSIVVTDALGASTTIKLGVVPFAPVLTVPVRALTGDANFRSRRVSVDGNLLVTCASPSYTDSAKALVYDLSSGSPVLAQTLTGTSNLRDIVVKSGVAYGSAGSTLNAWDLSVNPATRVSVTAQCTDGSGVLVDGNRAYLGLSGNCGDARIASFDLTNPKSPTVINNGMAMLPGVSGATFTQLLPFGATKLVGITQNASHDILILDRTNPAAIVKTAELDVPGYSLFRARIVGHMLYAIAPGSTTTPHALIIVDLNSLTTPAVIVTTPGIPIGLEVDPATLRVYVADLGPGVTVVDASVPSSAHIIATQPLPGEAWEGMLVPPKLYLAGDTVFNVLDFTATGGSSILPAPAAQSAPRTLRAERPLISAETRNGALIVRGARGALLGPQPITVEIRNLTLGTSQPGVTVAADGSFEAAITAAPEDHIVVVATSGDGARVEIDLGTHE